MDHALMEAATVRELALNGARVRRVLDAFGIDYCLNGHLDLGTVVAQGRADREELLAALRKAEETPDAGEERGRDWTAASLTELMDHILSRHHTYMKMQLARVEDLLGETILAHRLTHGNELARLRKVFESFSEEIERHLFEEEEILFPYIRRLDAHAQGRCDKPFLFCGSVRYPIREMGSEHETAGRALGEMRAIASNYRVPEDACESYRALYEALQDLELDTREHIHLENNVLFPRAIELEAGKGTGEGAGG